MMRDDDVKSLLTGAGLAFSLGWLWFPWLSAVWLPGLAWGSAGSGGGMIFLLILALGFPLGGSVAARLAVPGETEGGPASLLRLHSRHVCHAAAYAMLVLTLFLRLHGPAALPKIWPYLALAAAALAFLSAGLYWTGRLMALPRAAAPAAFLAAVVLAALVGQAAVFFPPEVQWLIWPQGTLVAWVLAELLVRRETQRPKARGRPRKKEPESDARPLVLPAGSGETAADSPRLWAGLALALAAIGFAAGSAWSFNGNGAAIPAVWLAGLSFGLGAFVPAFTVRQPWSPAARGITVTLVAVLLLVAMALVPAWLFPTGLVILPALAEGAVSGLALALLAGLSLEQGTAARRAGMVGGISVAFMNGGWVAGEMTAAATHLPLAIVPAAAAGVLLAGPQIGAFLKLRKVGGLSAEGSGQIGDDTAAGIAEAAFTEEEMRLLSLLAREDLSNQDIATRLFISRSTVRYHLKKLYAKTGTANRADLVRFALPRLEASCAAPQEIPPKDPAAGDGFAAAQ